MHIEKLLKPSSMAIVGASEKAGFGGDTCRIVLQYQTDLSRVYFVNPKRDSVFGRRCYHSLEEIGDELDLVIVCTPKATVNDILRSAGGCGCKGAVVFASGYRETGAQGLADEAELVDLCNSLDITLMGPNCAGFANYIDGVFSFAFLTDIRDRTGTIGLVSQSGQVCLSALDLPNLKFSYLISCGNSSSTTVEDYIDFLADDPDTTVVCVYSEGIRKPKTLMKALQKAADRRKPVVFLKSGTSEKASQLASSHTGSLSGNDKTISAIFEKYGVIRVNDLQELYFTAHVFATLLKLPKSPAYVSLNVSGGEACITADLAKRFGITLAQLSERTTAALEPLLPFYATANNPLDMTATLAYDPEKLAQAIRILMAQEDVGALLLGYTFTEQIIDTTIPCLIDALERVSGEPWCKPILWVSFASHTPNAAQYERLNKLQVPLLITAQYAFLILQHLNRFSAYDGNRDFHVVLPDQTHCSTRALSERSSRAELAAAGFEVGAFALVDEIGQLEAALERIGYPCVMKIDSDDILHKTNIGGVALNIKDLAQASEAYVQIRQNAARHCPNAVINGILVEPMLPQGLEVIVGINNDSLLGPTIMAGLGGVFVELFGDVSIRLCPINAAEARDMLRQLNAWALFQAYRGGRQCDIEALVDFMVKLSRFAVERVNSIREIDINPLFLYENGAAIADALIIKKEPGEN